MGGKKTRYYFGVWMASRFVFLFCVYFFFSINTFKYTKHLLWQLLPSKHGKMLWLSMDIFRNLQTVFWKPFAVQDVLGSFNLRTGRKFLPLDAQVTAEQAPHY